MRQVPLTVALLVAAGSVSVAAQWSQFRGPNASGVAPIANYPVEFSASKNVAWKAAVPYGQSSPVVVRDRLYVTASEKDRLLTIAFDARTGKESWRRDVGRERRNEIYKANDPASGTPAADINGVVAFFPDFGLVAYSTSGQPRWTAPLGPFKNFYGLGTSPIIANGLVVLVCDQETGSFAIAFDRVTGRQRWRVERPGLSEAWSTPIVFRPTGGRADLVVLGTERIDGYELSTGKSRWWIPIVSGGSMGAPLVYRDTVIAATLGSAEPGLPTFAAAVAQYDKDKDGRISQTEFQADKGLAEHFGYIDQNGDKFLSTDEWNDKRELGVGEFGAMAVRPGEVAGKLAAGAIQWHFKKNLPYIPVPLVYRDVLYMVKTGGIVTSLNPATGALLKEGRSGALGEYYASPIAADGKVFLANQQGKVSVLKAGAQWEVLSVNDVGDEINATPALSEGRIYVRTRGSLYCFAASSK